jgi:hypothetical protein
LAPGRYDLDAVDWGALSDAFSRLERLREDETGLLSFGMPDAGGIFVERGRVCFVAARGHAQRLRDVLLERSNIDADVLDRVSEQCRIERKWLGQTLVAQGLIPAAELEQALRYHSAECLLELCREPLPTRWASHVGRGFAPRFTFPAVELLLDTVGLVVPMQRAQAIKTLARLERPRRQAAAFLIDAEHDRLLPVAEVGGQDVGALRALGRWAETIPRVSLELATETSFALAVTPKGESVFVWWKDGLLFTLLCEDQMELANVMAAHLATQRQSH